MKKKLLIGALSLIALSAISAATFTACVGTGVAVDPPSHTHMFGEWEVVDPATCTQEGKAERVCECGETETKALERTEHLAETDEAVAPTCSAVGYTEGTHCSVCNEVLNAPVEIAKLPHDYVSEIILQPAFEVEGTLQYSCLNCDDTYTESIPALDFRPSDVWTGDVAQAFESGEGTASSPYIIKTAAQLKYFADTVNKGERYSGKYLRLDSDIILNDVSNWTEWKNRAPANTWVPIGGGAITYENCTFGGTFDGNGHTIRGIYIKNSYFVSGMALGYGLFGKIITATVKNLGVTQSYISTKESSGGIVGYCDQHDGTSVFENCYFEGTIESQTAAGGIVGYGYFGWRQNIDKIHTGYIRFKNCYNTGTITAVAPKESTGIAGGIMGDTEIFSGACSLTDCYNSGKITGQKAAGGLIGKAGHYSSSPTVSFELSIAKSYNKGRISSETFSGGIAGTVSLNECTINVKQCYNAGEITGTAADGGKGGLFGLFSTSASSKSTIDLCYNTAKITGTSYTGGLVGYMSAGSPTDYTLTGCVNQGEVTGTDDTGGLIGYAYSKHLSIDSCYNSANVTGNENVGGIVGNANIYSITNVYNEGDINGVSIVGGIVGKTVTSISTSFNYGQIHGTNNYVGAICGKIDTGNSGKIKNCFFLAACAKDGQDVIQSMFGCQNIGKAYGNTAYGSVTASNMTKQKSFTDFDFYEIWILSQPHPVLRNVVAIPTED